MYLTTFWKVVVAPLKLVHCFTWARNNSILFAWAGREKRIYKLGNGFYLKPAGGSPTVVPVLVHSGSIQFRSGLGRFLLYWLFSICQPLFYAIYWSVIIHNDRWCYTLNTIFKKESLDKKYLYAKFESVKNL